MAILRRLTIVRCRRVLSIKQGLTTDNAEEQAATLRSLLEMQCGNGLMHESVNVDKPSSCTRPIFEWANEMLGTA